MDVRPSRTNNPEVWLETCPEVSRPLCETVRDWILTWEPDLSESIKWNMLCYTGQKHVCALGGFKKWAGLTFFRGAELPDAAVLCDQRAENASVMTIRFTSIESIDRWALKRLLRAAVHLDETVPPLKIVKEPRPLPEIPPILAKALQKNGAARRFFESLKPTYQREYLIWVGTAKLPETQQKRLTETMTALTAGRKWAQRK
ncbi:MAG TPA: YdeI/OmpD-associated family protein [Verrucomicrobiales bacterium]|nr:YdeI/OmpD-associated family protein [Verrucomicrobiales bacterium]